MRIVRETMERIYSRLFFSYSIVVDFLQLLLYYCHRKWLFTYDRRFTTQRDEIEPDDMHI